MEYTVFLTQQSNTHWEATIPELPNCVVAAATRAEALANIQHLAVAVVKRSEVVRLHVPTAPLTEIIQTPPGFGAFQDDPTLASLFAEIERRRDANLIGA